MRRFFILTFLSLLAACQTMQNLTLRPEPDEQKVEPVEHSGVGLKLTKQGNNIEPAFSPDGFKITFVSDSRFSHKNRQLYEYTISTRTERRVSFSDGDIFMPIYSSSGDSIYYSSTTDEIKERPFLFYPNKYQFRIPKDLYSSDSYGKKIERILNSEGSQADFHQVIGKNDEFIFVSSLDDQSKIMKMNARTKSGTALKSFSNNEIRRPLMNKKGDLFWLENSSLKFQKSGKGTMTLPVDDPILDLKWANPGKNILMYLTQNKNKKYEIDLFNEVSFCHVTIFSTEKKITGIDYSPKGNKLIFSLEEDGKNHIYLRELRASDLEALTCEAY